MLRNVDKLLIAILAFIALYYYGRKNLGIHRVKKYARKAKPAEKKVMDSLEKEGYLIVDICPAKRIQYYKDGVVQQEYIEPKLVIKDNGKRLVVEKHSSSQSVSLRDYQIKLKIITNMVCYNIKGILFIDTKGSSIKECSIKITHEFRFIKIVKRIGCLVLAVFFGFYMSSLF